MGMKEEIFSIATALGYDGPTPTSKTKAVHAVAEVAGNAGGGGNAGYEVTKAWAVPEQTVTSKECVYNEGTQLESRFYGAAVAVGDLAKMYADGPTDIALTVDGIRHEAEFYIDPVSTECAISSIDGMYSITPFDDEYVMECVDDTEPTSHTVSALHVKVTTTEDFDLAMAEVVGYGVSKATTSVVDEQTVTSYASSQQGNTYFIANVTLADGCDLAQMYEDGKRELKLAVDSQELDASLITMSDGKYGIMSDGYGIQLHNDEWTIGAFMDTEPTEHTVSCMYEASNALTSNKFDLAVAESVSKIPEEEAEDPSIIFVDHGQGDISCNKTAEEVQSAMNDETDLCVYLVTDNGSRLIGNYLYNNNVSALGNKRGWEFTKAEATGTTSANIETILIAPVYQKGVITGYEKYSATAQLSQSGSSTQSAGALYVPFTVNLSTMKATSTKTVSDIMRAKEQGMSIFATDGNNHMYTMYQWNFSSGVDDGVRFRCIEYVSEQEMTVWEIWMTYNGSTSFNHSVKKYDCTFATQVTEG